MREREREKERDRGESVRERNSPSFLFLYYFLFKINFLCKKLFFIIFISKNSFKILEHLEKNIN